MLNGPRALAPEELPRLVLEATAVFRPGAPRPSAMGDSYPLLFDPAHAHRLRIITESNDRGLVIAAHAGYALLQADLAGTRARVACFGAVFTSPGYEGRGLATRVFADAVAAARAEGAEAGLVSGRRGLYLRAGFQTLPPAVRLRLHAKPDARVSWRPATPLDIPAVSALHGGLRTRFIRTPGEWARLLAARMALFRPGQVWLAERAGAPIAYAALEDDPRLDESGARIARSIEQAGELTALAAAAHTRGADVLELVASPDDAAVLGLARAEGLVPSSVDYPFAAAVWEPRLVGRPLPFYGLNYV